MPTPFRVAAIQDSPVWLDRAATTEKTCRLIAEAAGGGAQIIAFPESFLPGFPHWVWTRPFAGSTDFHRLLHDQAVSVSGAEIDAVREAAREAHATVILGITERTPGSLGTLYDANVVISPEGDVIGMHRKLTPTAAERIVWAGGDGSSLTVHGTPHGALGTLICSENLNTLARFALLMEGERIHVANFPSAALEGTRGIRSNEIYLNVAPHAYEGKLFVILAMEHGVPEIAQRLGIEWWPDVFNCISGVVGPDGEWIGDPLLDQPGIVFADCDPAASLTGRLFQDITGHYNRFDIFDLRVDRTKRHDRGA